jgi:hypothetical protein
LDIVCTLALGEAFDLSDLHFSFPETICSITGESTCVIGGFTADDEGVGRINSSLWIGNSPEVKIT